MWLFFMAIMFFAHAAALLIDCLLLLLLVRALSVRWEPAILSEVNDAARPLVDRTLSGVQRLWRQFRPERRILENQRMLVASITLSLARLLLAVVTGLVVSIG